MTTCAQSTNYQTKPCHPCIVSICPVSAIYLWVLSRC